ncbi:BON domain-containing protein [Pleurocapsa sp. PCC 7319]|uniref:BON domain-containing protein n=1 Tax=Pleurocapsa sp. PCC 7319 TaxID=118161 RepID=UPI00034B4323|nr:BON domain-containing protein [Pleurocapsa sp. PCC 7319]
MNSFPDNLPSQTDHSPSSKSNSDPIDELLDFVLSLDPSLDNLPLKDETLVNNSQASSKTSNFVELELTQQETENKVQPELDNNSNIRYFDLNVEVQSKPRPEITLPENIDSKAFRSKSFKPKKRSLLETDQFKVSSIPQPENEAVIPPASPEDLVELVNTLIPLIVELLRSNINYSEESIIQSVAPVIDQLIEKRSLEDSEKMATAIAKILPHAITTEINLSPKAIAKAIAPEIALSIKEQILLDENAISQALGSEMGKAMKNQIELERDAMVDALYPVIGNTISKYMVEVVKEINRKVENTLSTEGIKRKIRAKIQGVSEAELIFQESIRYHVQAIFLIDKASGLVIQEVQPPEEQHLDSDMVAGMLTAIRSFANDCIASGSELDTIDYGDWQIPIEVAGYCYLAVVLKGEPSKQFRTKIRQILGKIVLNYGDAIEKYQGDVTTVPQAIRPLMEELITLEDNQSSNSSSSPILLWLLAIALTLIVVPWGIVKYRGRVARNVEQITANQLDAAPELSVYRIESKVHRGKLTLSGRVPSEYLRDQAAKVTQDIAQQRELQLDNQILTVDVPVNPTLIKGEVQRLTNLFNRQQPGTIIKTHYQPKTLTIDGFVLNESDLQTINQTFQKIPGIKQIIVNVAQELPFADQRIYFDYGSSKLNYADNSSTIEVVKQLLNQYPQLHLKLISHSDGLGSIEINQKLGQKRCQNVLTALVAEGIEPSRLIMSCSKQLLNQDKNHQSTWLNRYVSFEPFIPKNQHK